MVWLLPILVGIFVVLQGTLNKQMSDVWGLGFAIFVNGCVFFAACTLLFVLARLESAPLPDFFRFSSAAWQWWYLVPGLFGFGIVVGIPWAMQSLGAFKVFAVIVAVQVLGSLLWDVYVGGLRLDQFKMIGGLLIILGTVLVMRPG